MKTYLINAALLVATVVVMVVGAEAALRFYFFATLAAPRFAESPLMPHPTRAYALEPGLAG